MNTNHHTEPIHLILKDGNMQLAEWTQAFDSLPTVGESIQIPDHLKPSLQGYDPEAMVSRVVSKGNSPYRLHLEAKCELTYLQRPVIVLNSNRIPQPHRAAIEAHLRGIFRLPVIDWEGGQTGDPILRFHEPATGRKTILATLQEEIRGLIPEPVTF